MKIRSYHNLIVGAKISKREMLFEILSTQRTPKSVTEIPFQGKN